MINSMLLFDNFNLASKSDLVSGEERREKRLKQDVSGEVTA